MTGNEAILFVFIFILFGGGASIFTFIAVNLIWGKINENADIDVEIGRNHCKY